VRQYKDEHAQLEAGISRPLVLLLATTCGAAATAAPAAGRLADRGHGRLAMTGSILVLLASWGLLALGKSSVVALIAGIAALDLGLQATHISNQSAIYTLHGMCVPGAATAAIGLAAWLITEKAITGRLPIGADSAA